MSQETSILIVGRNPSMMERVLHLLGEHQIQAKGVFTDEEAIHLIQTSSYKVIVFGGGVESASVQQIENAARAVHANHAFVYAHPHTILDDLKRVLGS